MFCDVVFDSDERSGGFIAVSCFFFRNVMLLSVRPCLLPLLSSVDHQRGHRGILKSLRIYALITKRKVLLQAR